jgi:hypothetical protein
MGCTIGQVPDEAREAFKQRFPNAENAAWNIDRNGYNEVEFTLDGKKYRADFDAKGEWVETESSVKWDDLPLAVQEAFKLEDKKKDIVEIEFVHNREKGKFYDIEFKKGGGKLDIAIRPDGTVLGTDNH